MDRTDYADKIPTHDLRYRYAAKGSAQVAIQHTWSTMCIHMEVQFKLNQHNRNWEHAARQYPSATFISLRFIPAKKNSARFNVFLSFFFTYSTEYSPSWEANRFSASQETPHISWNPKVDCRTQNCQTPIPILSQVKPVHAPHPTSWRSILILSSHLCLVVSFPQGSPPKPCRHLYSRHTCYLSHASHSSRFDHPNNIGWGVQTTKLLIMQFSPLPFTSSLLGPNILRSTLFSNTLKLPFFKISKVRKSCNLKVRLSRGESVVYIPRHLLVRKTAACRHVHTCEGALTNITSRTQA